MRREQSHNRMRVETSDDVVTVYFTSSRIVDDNELNEIGVELVSAVELAAMERLPLFLSFHGVKAISSALVGKLVLVNKKARDLNVPFRMCDLSPAIAETFRRLGPDGGWAGMCVVLKPGPKDGGARANPKSDDGPFEA